MPALEAELKVRLTAELKAELEAAAAEEYRKPAALARQAIREFLNRRRAELEAAPDER